MTKVRSWIRHFVIAGNAVFVLWIIRNGMEAGFRGRPVEVASGVGLIALLVLNAALLWREDK